MKNLQRQNKFYINSEQSYADRFRDGFSQCTKEVAKFLYGQQNRAGEHIIVHLNECIRRLDNLTNASANNNMQIANNNNYIPNDSLQLELNQQQQPPSSFIIPPQHHHHHHHQNIRQPIAMPLVRKSPIPAQNYLPLPSQPQKLSLSAMHHEHRLIDNESPLLTRPISRDSLSSPPSASSSPGQLKEEPVWRPW